MKYIKIEYGDYSAIILPERGANCVSLRNKKYGAKILREPDLTKDEWDSLYLYGMPILFPQNRIEGGKFTFLGRDYDFGINEKSTGCYIHGEIHRKKFDVILREKNRVTASFTSLQREVYPGFPHAFKITVDYTLSDSGLAIITSIENLSDVDMPCLFAYHTTFSSRFAGDGDVFVTVPIKEEYERNMTVYLPTGNIPEADSVRRELSRGSFDPFSRKISKHYLSDSERMAITYKDKPLSLVYENDKKLPYRLIYNGNADEYICLEPQNYLVNGVNKAIGNEAKIYDVIAPHSSICYTSKIYLEENFKI